MQSTAAGVHPGGSEAALLSRGADEKMGSDKARDGLALLSFSRWGQPPHPPVSPTS